MKFVIVCNTCSTAYNELEHAKDHEEDCLPSGAGQIQPTYTVDPR